MPPIDGVVDGRAATTSRARRSRAADDDAPFAALAFKIMADPFVGKLTYFRVYSGKLEAGSRDPQRHDGPDRARSAAS